MWKSSYFSYHGGVFWGLNFLSKLIQGQVV